MFLVAVVWVETFFVFFPSEHTLPYSPPLLASQAFTYFAVLNVLTAVFCQSAIDGAQNDHASKVHAVLANKEAHLEKIHDLFSKFGADDGVITFSMFQKKINSPEVRALARISCAFCWGWLLLPSFGGSGEGLPNC